MKNNNFLLLLLLVVSYVSAQKIVIYDSINKTTLPYVAVLYGETGLYTDENGVFNKNEITTDSLTINYFGYKKVITKTKNIKDTIFIDPLPQELAQVVIKNKYIEIIVKQPKKSRNFGGFPLTKESEIFLLVKPKEKTMNALIKSISLRFNKKINYFLPEGITKKQINAVFRINIYSMNNDLPVEKIFSSKTNVISLSKNNDYILDFENEKISIPKEGLAFSVELIGYQNSPIPKESNHIESVHLGLCEENSYKDLIVKTVYTYGLNKEYYIFLKDRLKKTISPDFDEKYTKRDLIMGFVFLK